MMPFEPVERMSPGAVVLDKVVHENPADSKDHITIYICRPCLHLMTEEVRKLVENDQHVEGVRAYLNSYRSEALEGMVAKGGGALRIKVDKKDLELRHKVHFYLGARDRWPAEGAPKQEEAK